MNDFKCPNCFENSTLIVKIYKMTNKENYFKCGRCLHVWLRHKKQFKDFLFNVFTIIFGALCFGGLVITYIEKLWFYYVAIVLMVGIVGLTNYIVNHRN